MQHLELAPVIRVLVALNGDHRRELVQLCRRVARILETSLERDRRRFQAESRIAMLARLPDRIEELMAQGLDYDAAAELLTAGGDVPRPTVDAWWRLRERKRLRQARCRRDAEILSMAARGMTRRAIARQVGLSAARVGQIVTGSGGPRGSARTTLRHPRST